MPPNARPAIFALAAFLCATALPASADEVRGTIDGAVLGVPEPSGAVSGALPNAPQALPTPAASDAKAPAPSGAAQNDGVTQKPGAAAEQGTPAPGAAAEKDAQARDAGQNQAAETAKPGEKAQDIQTGGRPWLLRELRGEHINSPKSAVFSPDGSLFYVHSLEGSETCVFDAKTLELKTVIKHVFRSEDAGLFVGGEDTLFDYEYTVKRPQESRNCFAGKPVESTFSHAGRYLWVTYYRRDYDHNASCPSAVAVIDTKSNAIVRVIPTGPLPKMLAASPDGKYMAITHWGDNSIGLLRIDSDNPTAWAYERHIISGHRLAASKMRGNRDKTCGQCLRGTVFTPDSRHLLVGKMSGSSHIAVFDVATGDLVGTLSGIPVTPRHLALSPDGKTLYVSSNTSGYISAWPLAEVLERVTEAGAKKPATCPHRELFVGKGSRTLAVSKDGSRIYVACNLDSKVVAVDAAKWRIVGSHRVAPYAVGLGVSPDGSTLAVTSQGRHGRGGHVVSVFSTLTIDPATGKPIPQDASVPAKESQKEKRKAKDGRDYKQAQSGDLLRGPGGRRLLAPK